MSAYDDYVRVEEELLSKRRAGAATEAEEDRLTDELEYLWRQMSAEERRAMRQSPPGTPTDRPPDLKVSAGAAQSPQEGAADLRLEVRRTSFRFSEEKPDGKRRRLYLSLDERDGDPKGFGKALGRVFQHRDRVTLIRTAELEALRALAELGRSVSGRPSNEPAESSVPLAALLRDIDNSIFWGGAGDGRHGAWWRVTADIPGLKRRIDAALARSDSTAAPKNDWTPHDG